MQRKLYLALLFLFATCGLVFAQEDLTDSQKLVAEWQRALDETGRLHIPFDPNGLTVTTVGKSGITSAVRYNVKDSLEITPDFDYEISSDPRVEINFNGGENSSFIRYEKKVTNSEWTGRLYVHDLDVRATGADWMSVIRTFEFKMAFNKPIFERCTFFATGYAFDFKDVNYCVVPVFRDIMTGGGATITKPALRIVGGGDGKTHPLYVVLRDAWKPTPDKYGVWGRAVLKLERPILNGREEVAREVLRNLLETPNLYVEDAMTESHNTVIMNEINTTKKRSKDWSTYPVSPYYESLLESDTPDQEPKVDPVDDGTDEGTNTPVIDDPLIVDANK